MLVSETLESDPAIISPLAALEAAARRMRDERLRFMIVCDEGRASGAVVGVITDRDIVVRCVAAGSDCHKRTVREVMSAELLVCFDDQPVEEARRLMTEYKVRRLPVLDHGQRLVGIVSLDDLTGVDLRTRPQRVAFYKTLSGSGAGRPCNVPLAIVHVTGCQGRDAVEAAAIRRFERDRGIESWTRAADGYELLDQE